MSLKFKLLSIMGVSVFGFIIFGAIAWDTLNIVKVNGAYYQKIALDKDLIADILPPPEYIIESYLVLFEAIEEKDNEKLKDLLHKTRNLGEEYEKRHEFWSKNLQESKLKDQLITKSYGPAKEFFEIVSRDFIPAILQGNRDKARDLMTGALKTKYREHRLAIDDVVKLANERLEKTESEVKDVVRHKVIFLIAVALAIIALSLSLTWYFVEFRITRQIVGVISGLEGAAQQVTAGSIEVSSASQSLAEGASEQAAGLEETSSSIEEMASMTKQNASNANQANTLMTETSQVVNEANRAMVELTGSMKEITTASEETAKIIKTIDAIAFQTNLLALNAAVEAARAGEAGAGFAVVADEVRNLAMRASDAAKNTANLIEGSVKKIKNGSDIVTKTNEAFSKVAAGSKKVGELVGEISAASNEQAQGIDQINKAVAEMDKVVQKNAASAEESASASEEMNAQAETMKGFVGELVAVVGGSKNGNGKQAMALDHQPKAKAGIHKVLPILGKKEKSGGGEVLALQKAKEVNPGPIISMEEGDFGEF